MILNLDKLPFLKSKSTSDEQSHEGFGTFKGVYVPSILMMFGVIIYLRMGVITGQAGLWKTLFMVMLAGGITLITTLSISVTATNSRVGTGGMYYMISRSFGIELGGAVGIPLFIKQGISIAFCTVGFAESLCNLFPELSMPIVGVVTLILLTIFAYKSADIVLKIQLFIFVVILASLVSFFTGSPIETQDFTVWQGPQLSFWAIFSLFFPAMTGIESAAALSGDLKNPSKSLPLGTVGAVLTAIAVYLLMPICLNRWVPSHTLATDPLVIHRIASSSALIHLGIWGATLSSALGGLLGAPRTLQALAQDKIVPQFFGKGHGPKNEPRIATAFTFLISLGFVCWGTIDSIAPILTMICLVSYGMLNLAAGLEDLMSNPSWRPAFHLPWTISLSGAGLCLLVMLMIEPGYALETLFGFIAIYAYLKKRGMKTYWSDIRQGVLLFFSRFAIYRLDSGDICARSWRPNFLVFCDTPNEQSDYILNFSSSITRSKGFLTLASVIPYELADKHDFLNQQQLFKKSLQEKKIQALVEVAAASNVPAGMKRFICDYRFGPLRPNTVVLGGLSEPHQVKEYAALIKEAHEEDHNVLVIRDNSSNIEGSNPFDIKKKAKRIDIWWDESDIYNSNLMLALAYMLQRNPNWKRHQVCLKSLVKEESERSLRKRYFDDFMRVNHLKMDNEILVGSYHPSTFYDMVSQFSSDAELCFVGIAPPEEAEADEVFELGLWDVMQKMKGIKGVVLAMSARQDQLGECFKQPEVEDYRLNQNEL